MTHDILQAGILQILTCVCGGARLFVVWGQYWRGSCVVLAIHFQDAALQWLAATRAGCPHARVSTHDACRYAHIVHAIWMDAIISLSIAFRVEGDYEESNGGSLTGGQGW